MGVILACFRDRESGVIGMPRLEARGQIICTSRATVSEDNLILS